MRLGLLQRSPEAIRQMFAELAPYYDRSNTLLTAGLHYWWRWRAVRWSEARSGMAVLDCATGTGDFAFAFWRAVRPQGYVVGVDFCEPMLERARQKAQRRGVPIQWMTADCHQLPFPDATFDISAAAFGIRNMREPERCLREMARVVRPGGRVVILELGQPKGIWAAPYWFYSRYWIPLFGSFFARNRQAYEYLHVSSATFPSGRKFVELMERTGAFCTVRAYPLMAGIAWCYVGTVG
ncbi:MAG: bifunctional demethylmenaquinone methyltransferase/2-methoxy-6-polyprenyl-1,4-benzoquinol methylase UbiE [Candidatus Kapabacteria bacterium]|nr:bifunctional demethylmenaquinone methyltransferase/2-methoxy-6-polyprenyl-1,4-benzoquinol methylase UbiE [Candidatus Kapabacteria bacterium]MDW8011931.1 bifunctional demethylmenaquinone methyltransferase/2-methoxy-6-polyprenyl-1,4-benzoquinol methylase UbiE [Bacteroidota bacterium]